MGESQTVGGSRGGAGSSVMLLERLRLGLSTVSHHPSLDPHSTARAPETPRPSSLLPIGESRWELLAVSRSFWGADGADPPLWWVNQRKRAEQKKGKKQPGLACCECISWAAALRCASVCTGFCRREGDVGPDGGRWVLKPANTLLKRFLK